MKPFIGSEVHADRPIDENCREHEPSLNQLSTYDAGPSGCGGEHRHSGLDLFLGGRQMCLRDGEIFVPKRTVEVGGHRSDHDTIIGPQAVAPYQCTGQRRSDLAPGLLQHPSIDLSKNPGRFMAIY
jgi:hypothetical protein